MSAADLWSSALVVSLVLVGFWGGYRVGTLLFSLRIKRAVVDDREERLRRCNREGHAPRDAHELGIDPKRPGWVDFYCPRCQVAVSTQPILEVTDPATLETIAYLREHLE